MDEKEKAVIDAGIQYGMQMLQQIPRGDQLSMEAHITGVLIVFWGALWGSFGTEYARGFIESQLRGMEPDVPKRSRAFGTENTTPRTPETMRCQSQRRTTARRCLNATRHNRTRSKEKTWSRCMCDAERRN